MKLRIGLYSLPMIMASTLIAESLPEKFFEQHCLNCHGEDMAKGDLTLHDLAADFTHAETVDIWQIVLEQLETSEMPPKKKPRHGRPILSCLVPPWTRRSSWSESWPLTEA